MRRFTADASHELRTAANRDSQRRRGGASAVSECSRLYREASGELLEEATASRDRGEPLTLTRGESGRIRRLLKS